MNPNLSDLGATPPPWYDSATLVRFERVVRLAASLHGVEPAALFLETRGPAIASQARQLAMAALRAAGFSLQGIAETFRRRDHGTVLGACRAVARRRNASPAAENMFRQVLILTLI